MSQSQNKQQSPPNSDAVLDTNVWESMDVALKQRDLIRQIVPGNGDCLFTALALGAGQSGANLLRQQLVDYIRLQFPELGRQLVATSGGDLDDICDELRKKGTWGGEEILHAAASWLQRNVTVIGPQFVTIFGSDGLMQSRPHGTSNPFENRATIFMWPTMV